MIKGTAAETSATDTLTASRVGVSAAGRTVRNCGSLGNAADWSNFQLVLIRTLELRLLRSDASLAFALKSLPAQSGQQIVRRWLHGPVCDLPSETDSRSFLIDQKTELETCS